MQKDCRKNSSTNSFLWHHYGIKLEPENPLQLGGEQVKEYSLYS